MDSKKSVTSLLDRDDIPSDAKELIRLFIEKNKEDKQKNKLVLFGVQEAIQGEKEKLKLIMDNIPHHVFWKDVDSRYLGCNTNYARAVGLEKPEEIIGKSEIDF